MNGPAAVAAHGWGWRHAGRRAWAVRDLDLRVGAGERILLLGASGSGKSTVLAGMGGLLAGQDSGEATGTLTLDGVPAAEARHRVGTVLQDPEAQIVMGRVGDDVAFGPENFGVPADDIWPRVADALALAGFPYPMQRPTAALSGGEKQRLALAGVLAMRPGLLLLDEPTANLDPPAARAIVAAVSDAARATGATVVVVEHRVEVWLPHVDRVVVLADAGGLLADGAPDEVFARYGPALRSAGIWLPGVHAPTRVARRPADTQVLRADGVGFTYRGASVPVVHPTQLGLRAGELTAITGRSGSGKSTLAMLVAGLARPTRGTVRALDDPRLLHRWPARRLAAFAGTVFQDPEHQFVRPTVREELELGPRRLGWRAPRIDQRVSELLERLRLTPLAEANPFTLSGGQKRRLSVATALVAAPRLLVLDEPTFGQDALTWRELADLLAGVRDDGVAVLVVSHDEPFVDSLADRRLTMIDGVLSS